jgi:N-acetylneuraminic acid mutarotase
MSTARAVVAVCALNGLLYACGGFDASYTHLSSVEVFNPALAAWSAVAPMPAARSSACAAALGGRVYVCGGFPVTETMVSYDPAADVWREEPSMHYMRYVHAVASVDGLLYVSGGYGKLAGSDDSGAALSSAEVFDPATGVWTLLPAMPESRRWHALVHAEKA